MPGTKCGLAQPIEIY